MVTPPPVAEGFDVAFTLGSDVVHELKEAQVERQFFFVKFPDGVANHERAQQRPEPLGGVDMDLVTPSPSSSRAYSPWLWQHRPMVETPPGKRR